MRKTKNTAAITAFTLCLSLLPVGASYAGSHYRQDTLESQEDLGDFAGGQSLKTGGWRTATPDQRKKLVRDYNIAREIIFSAAGHFANGDYDFIAALPLTKRQDIARNELKAYQALQLKWEIVTDGETPEPTIPIRSGRSEFTPYPFVGEFAPDVLLDLRPASGKKKALQKDGTGSLSHGYDCLPASAYSSRPSHRGEETPERMGKGGALRMASSPLSPYSDAKETQTSKPRAVRQVHWEDLKVNEDDTNLDQH